MLRQISNSKASVSDLRTQLTDFQSNASQSHAALQIEVDSYRDRRRQEDASRLELKSRTKTLEDSKRNADSGKRDAEKRLKTTQNARNDTTRRLEDLDKEIGSLQQRSADDEYSLRQSREGGVSQDEQAIAEALEQKRQEIKAAEEVVAKLNLRAKELEEKLSAEKEKLTLARERAELRKQDLSFHPLNGVNAQDSSPPPWSPVQYGMSFNSNPSSRAPTEYAEPADALHGTETKPERNRRMSDPRDRPTSPRPGKLTLGGISNFNGILGRRSSLRSNGYSIFDDAMNPPPALSPAVVSKFAPFDAEMRPPSIGIVSPTSQSLIPAGLISSLDDVDNSSRSFQSENDLIMDRDWRANSMQQRIQRPQGSDSQSPHFGPMTTSPISLHGPSATNEYEQHDPFEVRIMPHHQLPAENPMDNQRVSLLHRTYSDPSPPSVFGSERSESFSLFNAGAAADATNKASPASRRWFPASRDKQPKKGLNPDAKVFSLSANRTSPPVVVPPRPSGNAYDALNPNGLGSGMLAAAASTNHSLLRAFAPSPAEREALQRALGGSTNTSLERLPSLSDVGSIPPSPSHVHAAAAAVLTLPSADPREIGKVLPSWLQSLPRIRKPNFSPWEDEEPTSCATAVPGNRTNGSLGFEDVVGKR